MLKRSITAIFALSVLSGVAFADAASVAGGCSAGGNCVALVNAEIAGLSGSAAAKDKAIADLVVALGNASQSVTPEVRQNIAKAVAAAANAVTDPGQKLRIVQIAQAIQSGRSIQTAAVDDGTAASGQ
jgi:hypothetical protein